MNTKNKNEEEEITMINGKVKRVHREEITNSNELQLIK